MTWPRYASKFVWAHLFVSYPNLTVSGVGKPALILMQVHATGHTRGMSLLPTDNHATFISALSSKFPELSATGTIAVRFRDEDGDMLSLVDEGDYEAAVDVAR
jgi:hypothetical protein